MTRPITRRRALSIGQETGGRDLHAGARAEGSAIWERIHPHPSMGLC